MTLMPMGATCHQQNPQSRIVIRGQHDTLFDDCLYKGQHGIEIESRNITVNKLLLCNQIEGNIWIKSLL